MFSRIFHNFKSVQVNIHDQKFTNYIMVILGTRPEAVKLAPVIKALKDNAANQNFQTLVVSTGQHSTMLFQTLNVFNVKPDLHLNVMQAGQSLSLLTSKLLIDLDQVVQEYRPKIIIVQGDTTSAFAGSLVAFYHNIPIAHVEAGLRTWNLRSPFPEEFNRQAIGILTRYHFAATEWAQNNLLHEGKDRKSIFLTGNPVVDSLFSVLNSTDYGEILKQLISKIQLVSRNNSQVLLLTTHRRENQGNIMKGIFESVVELLKKYPQLIFVFPMHKNPNVYNTLSSVIPSSFLSLMKNGNLISDENWSFLNRFIIIEPLDYVNMIHMMKLSTIILTDSGGLQEEGVSLGKPVLIMRDTTERPEAVYSGGAILVGTSKQKIMETVSNLISNSTKQTEMSKARSVYGNGTAGLQIASILINALRKRKQFWNGMPSV